MAHHFQDTVLKCHNTLPPGHPLSILKKLQIENKIPNLEAKKSAFCD